MQLILISCYYNGIAKIALSMLNFRQLPNDGVYHQCSLYIRDVFPSIRLAVTIVLLNSGNGNINTNNRLEDELIFTS